MNTHISNSLAMLLLTIALPCGAGIPTSERNVLVDIYTSTNGGGWTTSTNWCSGSCPSSGTPTFNAVGTECTWHGVMCDATSSHVQYLELYSNNLTGTLPANVSQLQALQIFNVSFDHIGGPLPPLGNWMSLGTFAAFNNDFTGSIPTLNGATTMQNYFVSGNRLTGSIPSLAGMSALEDFEASDNELTGTLPDLTGASQLEFFYVEGNAISGALPSVPQPNHLLSAYLCPNPLDTTPNPNDGAWSAVTPYSPWYADPYPTNRCDDIFTGGFQSN